MKLRGRHVVLLVVLAVAAIAIIRAVTLLSSGPAAAPEDDFLAEARRLAEVGTDSSVAGTLPPVDGDASLVPVLVVDPPELLDLGVNPPDRPAEGEIKLYNKGRIDLEILQVQSSCGCMAARIAGKDKRIPPGGAGTIEIAFFPRRIPGFESRKTVSIMCNDPHNASVDVGVVVKFDPEFMVDPPELDFGEVRQGDTPAKTIVFRQLSDAPLEVTGLEPAGAAGPQLELSFEEGGLDPDHVEYTITVRLPHDLAPGAVVAPFNILSTCPRLPKFRYVVKAKVASFYTVSPAGPLVLRRVPGVSDNPPATVTFSAEGPLELAGVRATSDDLEVDVQTDAGPNTAVVEVRLRPEARAGSSEEALHYTIRSANETVKGRIPIKVVALH